MIPIISKSRLYRPSPQHLPIILLAIDAILLASERFRIFTFNHQKGCTVLIALAGVGVITALGLLWFVAALLLSCRFQYGIRSLIVLVVGVAVPCSWLAVELRDAKEQRDAILVIARGGGGVVYDYQRFTVGRQEFWSPALLSPVPLWLRELLGGDFFDRIGLVRINTDAEMECLRRIRDVRSLTLDATKVTDAGLENVGGLVSLEELNLCGTGVTDEGLANIERLSNLKSMDLTNTKVTDKGLVYLAGLPELQKLDLIGTKVSDVGLLHLYGLKKLRSVALWDTEVSDQGAKKLAGVLKNCKVGH